MSNTKQWQCLMRAVLYNTARVSREKRESAKGGQMRCKEVSSEDHKACLQELSEIAY